MSNAVEVDIAEAIKSELNSATFSLSFTAVRTEADPTVPLTELGTLRVDVVPWLPQIELAARGVLRYVVQTDILIRKRFEPSQQDGTTGLIPSATVDALRKLRQDITELFLPSQPTQTGRKLTAVPYANWAETTVMSGLVRPHMKQHRQYTGWIRVTYHVPKQWGT